MLKRLFTSNTRVKLLEVFLLNPNEEYYIRELTRKLDEQINSVRRELDNLKKTGLLKSRLKNRKKFYFINEDFVVLDELKSLFGKVLAKEKKIAADIESFGDIRVLVLTGIFTNQTDTAVDMLIVGEVDKVKLTGYLNKELQMSKPVRFAVITLEDYIYRLNCNDQFIKSIINEEKNLVPINKIA